MLCTEVSAEVFRFQIKKCSDLHQAKRLHDTIKNTRSSNLQMDTYLLNQLVEMYSRCNSVEDAEAVFKSIPQPNAYSWNIMLAAFAAKGHIEKAQKLFNQIPEPDVVSWNSLLSAFSRQGEVDQSLRVFNSAPCKNVITWLLLISAFANNRQFAEAVECFLKMDQEGFGNQKEACFVLVLECCVELQDLGLGKLIHEEVATAAKVNVKIATCLINMYASCGRVEQSKNVFDQIQDVNLVAKTCMIQAYARNGFVEQAGALFSSIPCPDVVASTCMLTAYARAGKLSESLKIYTSMRSRSVVASNAMISAYVHNDCLAEARELFNSMAEKDDTTWLIMLRAYTQKGSLDEAMELFLDRKHGMVMHSRLLWNTLISAADSKLALKLFRMMTLEGTQPDEVTAASVLDACSALSDIIAGKLVHEIILHFHLEKSAEVGTSLINMYGKCGRLNEAIQEFNRLEFWDVVSWSALVLAYARSGYSLEALELLPEMCNLGVQPNEVTWIGILFACSHAGLVEMSCSCLGWMLQDFFVEPVKDHYVCVVDLLGRSGWLDAAEQLIKQMPPEFDRKIAWSSLLAASKLHDDFERATRIGQLL